MLFFQRQEQIKDRNLRYGILFFSFVLHFIFVILSFVADTIKKDSHIITIYSDNKNVAKVFFGESKTKQEQNNKILDSKVFKKKINPTIEAPKAKPQIKTPVISKESLISKNYFDNKKSEISQEKITGEAKREETLLSDNYFLDKLTESEQITQEINIEKESSNITKVLDDIGYSLEESDRIIYNEIMANLQFPAGFKNNKPIIFIFDIGFDGKARNINARQPEVAILVYTAIKKAILKTCFTIRGRRVTLVVK